jgi:glycosyltransferase involved in cell wall biosynthesis
MSPDQTSPGPDEPELDAVSQACASIRILSTLPFAKTPAWRDAVHTLEPRRRLGQHLWARLGITDPLMIPRLLWRARRADVVLLNGGERVDLLYLALAGLSPWIRAPHLIVDAHWQPHRGLTGFIQRLVLRLGRRVLYEAQPHSPEEIGIYVREFGIPIEKIRPLPWSTSLNGYDIEPAAERRSEAVSGGFSYRDYATLFEAIRLCGVPLRVGLPPSRATDAARRRAADCDRIEIVSTWTFKDYWQAVADARVFVMALTPGLQRCSADQTLLNAMSFGTVVVATDSISSRLYIRHGENGFLVPQNDPKALANCLRQVMSLDEPSYMRISAQAAADVQTLYREDLRLARTLQRALVAVEAWGLHAVRRRRSGTDTLARALGLLAVLVWEVTSA